QEYQPQGHIRLPKVHPPSRSASGLGETSLRRFVQICEMPAEARFRQRSALRHIQASIFWHFLQPVFDFLSFSLLRPRRTAHRLAFAFSLIVLRFIFFYNASGIFLPKSSYFFKNSISCPFALEDTKVFQ